MSPPSIKTARDLIDLLNTIEEGSNRSSNVIPMPGVGQRDLYVLDQVQTAVTFAQEAIRPMLSRLYPKGFELDTDLAARTRSATARRLPDLMRDIRF